MVEDSNTLKKIHYLPHSQYMFALKTLLWIRTFNCHDLKLLCIPKSKQYTEQFQWLVPMVACGVFLEQSTRWHCCSICTYLAPQYRVEAITKFRTFSELGVNRKFTWVLYQNHLIIPDPAEPRHGAKRSDQILLNSSISQVVHKLLGCDNSAAND